MRGLAEFEQTWNGARYRFASAANRDRFANSPESFAPQYGGFCAFAVSRGYTADIDPAAWSIVDGKLLPELLDPRAADLGRRRGGKHPQGGRELADAAGEAEKEE